MWHLVVGLTLGEEDVMVMVMSWGIVGCVMSTNRRVTTKIQFTRIVTFNTQPDWSPPQVFSDEATK
jgi:hypothetical protein